MIDIRAAARALGGDVVGRDAVAAPGPPRDRSLTVKFAPRAPDGSSPIPIAATIGATAATTCARGSACQPGSPAMARIGASGRYK